MELDEKKYLYLLFILPLVVLVFLFNLYWKRKKQREFGDLEMVKKLSPESSVFKPVLKSNSFDFGFSWTHSWFGKSKDWNQNGNRETRGNRHCFCY